ncbi:ectoine hydrolase DoeA, partial [Salinicoccus roseus]|nr:ectoine hydrolase DoeA [Salinicoccus roseus]
PDWGEHTISFRAGDHTMLQPNMTFHLMPGLWFDNFGVSITESVYITEGGAETFASFDRKIFEKTAE